MKTLLLTIFFVLASFNLFASEDYKLHAVYKKADAPEGKTYIAVVKESVSDKSDWLIVFGNKNGKPYKRAFNFGGSSFYSYDGASNSGLDDFYKMVYKTPNKETMELTLTPRREGLGKVYQATYKLYESAASKRFAQAMIKEVREELRRVRTLEEITTLADFKARLNLVEWDFGFSGYTDDYESTFPFPTYDLQIEFYFQETLSDKAFATTLIKEDGSDVISKKFKESKTWYADSDEASYAVETIIEEGLQNDDWDWEVGEHSAFRREAKNLADEVLKKAAKNFVLYEITNTSGFECEDGIYIWESTTWVLIDGSTYTYSPGTECD